MSRIGTFLRVYSIFACLVACQNIESTDCPRVRNPITISSPTSSCSISKVLLNDQQKVFVRNGNAFAFRCLGSLYKQEEKDILFSPLSLQYALALTVNGASGETATEIVTALGLGSDTSDLNDYCNLLLNQLPALDGSVDLKLSDAIVVDENYKVLDSFHKTAEAVYYAPIEYVNASKPKLVVDRINEWAYRNTNGVVYPLLEEKDIKDSFVATILNSLYFKAGWSGDERSPMFESERTQKAQPFFFDGGGEGVADYMVSSQPFRYGRLGENGIVEIPYADGKFAMYVVLPDMKSGDGIKNLLSVLSAESWTTAISAMSSDTYVNLRLPRFEVSSSLELNGVLRALGVVRAFERYKAEFDKFLYNPVVNQFYISKVLQKAHLCVAEWGTEATAVTAVILASAGVNNVQSIDFFADHPFVYCIAEKTSGVILFEGIFDGK